MQYTEFRAKTLDEAITKACVAFSVTSSNLDYKVVQEASAGFLGIGSRPCVISARPKAEEPLMEAEVSNAAEAVSVKSESFAEEAAPAKEKDAAPVLEETVSPAEPETLAAAPEEAAPAKEEARYVSMDEIELRAARAAARAKENGEEAPAEEKRSSGREDRYSRNRRPSDRYDRRDSDRGRRGNDRRDGGRGGRSYRDRRGSRYDKPGIGTFVETKPHEPSVPKPERVVKPRTEEEVARLKDAAVKFLTDVFAAMHCEVAMTTSYDQKSGCLSINFEGEDMGILIGKRGQTLDSLQYLTSLIVNKESDEYVRVKLDTEDYRARRADTLENLARNVAYKVKQTGKAIALEPMNPYERRIIHSALQQNRFVETYSEGEEPYRHVVVAPRRS